MLIGVIQKQSLAEIAAVIAGLEPGLYDMLELRLDGCRDLSVQGLGKVLRNPPRPLPILLTLRSPAEGGAFSGSEAERLDLLEALMTLKPDFVDVEAAVAAARTGRIRAVSPRTRLILSWHDFTGTPRDLSAVLARMRERADNAIYKLAAFAHTTTDALRMLVFCREQQQKGVPMVGISMGAYGVSSRILAPVMHAGLSYCPVEESTAPGQLDGHTLRTIYRFATLNPTTDVYGLIGDPVEQSIGHIWHNARNAEHATNAVYVKWNITREELPEALPLLARLGVRGLSVTMPHKEAVVPLLTGVDTTAAAIGAVNTLRAETGGFCGTNTDGAGALHALPLDVYGKKLAVIGAGGAARALIHAADWAGARFAVFNRTPGKALPGAGAAIITRPLPELPALRAEGYDAIINTLPFDSGMDFSTVPFLPGRFAMDISYGKASAFLALAGQAGCTLVDGKGMYQHQATLQRAWWGQAV